MQECFDKTVAIKQCFSEVESTILADSAQEVIFNVNFLLPTVPLNSNLEREKAEVIDLESLCLDSGLHLRRTVRPHTAIN